MSQKYLKNKMTEINDDSSEGDENLTFEQFMNAKRNGRFKDPMIDQAIKPLPMPSKKPQDNLKKIKPSGLPTIMKSSVAPFKEEIHISDQDSLIQMESLPNDRSDLNLLKSNNPSQDKSISEMKS